MLWRMQKWFTTQIYLLHISLSNSCPGEVITALSSGCRWQKLLPLGQHIKTWLEFLVRIYTCYNRLLWFCTLKSARKLLFSCSAAGVKPSDSQNEQTLLAFSMRGSSLQATRAEAISSEARTFQCLPLGYTTPKECICLFRTWKIN